MPERGENGGVVITPVDLWEKLLDIELAVAKRFTELESRIGNLEKFRWMTVGGGAVIGTLFGTFGAYMVNYVLRK